MKNIVLQGDCLELMKDIDDKSIDMILCDLPYAITASQWDVIIPFDLLWLQYERIIKDNGAIVLTASQPFTTDLINSNRKLFRYELIWHKRTPSNILNANKMPLKTHENILFFYKKLPTYNPIKTIGKKVGINQHKINSEGYGNTKQMVEYANDGSRMPTSVVDITGVVNNSKQKLPHPTQKPIALFEYLIKTYTNEGDLVLDNCAGSGTTAIAALNTNRNYILMEKEEKYFNIINERIKNHEKENPTIETPLF